MTDAGPALQPEVPAAIALKVPPFDVASMVALGERAALLRLTSFDGGREWHAVVDLSTSYITHVVEDATGNPFVEVLVPAPPNPAPRPRSHGFEPKEAREELGRDKDLYGRIGVTPPFVRDGVTVIRGHDDNGSDVYFVTRDGEATFAQLERVSSYSLAIAQLVCFQNRKYLSESLGLGRSRA